MGPVHVLKLGEPMRDGAPELKLGKLIRDPAEDDSLLFQPSRQALSNLAHKMRDTINGEYLSLKLDIKRKIEDFIASVFEYLSGDQVTEEECDVKLKEFNSIISLILDSMDEDVTFGGSGAGPKIGEVD
ncbi:heat shock 70 kDa protein-like [Rosa rugosa]|uniref:heat shock 70 kDa protein-like n=1 Tax=Rosa rugosa TaxID=74645 RepID=UPI002B404161|nr:heat shock 70 kDa protein-like [Rosa rugosa]